MHLSTEILAGGTEGIHAHGAIVLQCLLTAHAHRHPGEQQTGVLNTLTKEPGKDRHPQVGDTS